MSVEQRDRAATGWEEESYRSIFENSPVGIYRSTLDGRLLRANPALVAFSGYASEAELLDDLSKRSDEWYVDPGRRAEFHRLMAEHGATRNFVSEVYRSRTLERAWIREDAWSIRDADGTVRYFEGTVEDITAQVTARDRIREASQSLRISLAKESHLASLHGSLASVVAHQFRTPLAIIDSAAQRTARADRSPGGEELGRRMQQIRSAVRRLVHLIDTILSSARLEAGEVRPLLRRTDLRALIEETVAEIREWHAQAEIEVSLGELPSRLDLDPGLFQQVLHNVLSNAVKYSPSGPKIAIRGRTASGSVELLISDNGIGIDEQDIPSLFQRFFRAKAVDGVAGTGLGLSIARDIIRLHGGDITLTSVRHQGTTVRLTLPVDAAGQPEQAPACRPS